MRLLIATAISLIISLMFFLIIKLWGKSQQYIDYNHPFYALNTTESTMGQNKPVNNPSAAPFIFKIVIPKNITEELRNQKNIYLNIAVTMDQKLIVIDPNYENEKQISENKTFKYQNKNYSDIVTTNPDSAVLLESFKDQFINKKIIFNMQDNPLQATPVFVKTMKALGLESGDQFIYVSPYDPPAKDLKETQPTYLFGTTDPEILKIKALESLYLIEAATFRADFVIHPLTYYKQPFFTETLIRELSHRHKRFIIGPLADHDISSSSDNHNEYQKALLLKPFGVIVR